MKPTITILDYLWSLRNTWLKHDEDCVCEFEKLAEDHIEDTVTVDQWCSVRVVNGMPTIEMVRRTYEDWDDICGPKREHEELQALIDQRMSELTQLMSLQDKTERMSSE